MERLRIDSTESNFKNNLVVENTLTVGGSIRVFGSENHIINYGFLNNTGSVGVAGGNNNYSIYASLRVAASEFNAFSDRRIKKNINTSDPLNDLAKISKLRITDYNLKDSIANSKEVVKGMIAQEVKEVMPHAVRTSSNVIPDIFSMADQINLKGIDLEIKMSSSLSIKPNDKIRIISTYGSEELLVKEIKDNNSFTLAQTKYNHKSGDKIFVYGREVNDFLSIDFNQITSLNTSAIQSLIQENKTLKEKLNTVESTIEAVVQRLNKLESYTANKN